MLRCSAAALSKNTVAAAIASPARTTFLRGRRERNGVLGHVSTVCGSESIMRGADLCMLYCV